MTKQTPVAKMEFYAFWRYDQYPFFLGARIVETYDDGAVNAEGYGRVHPRLILPAATGEQLLVLQVVLRAKYREEQDKLALEFRNRMRGAFKNLGVSYDNFPHLSRED